MRVEVVVRIRASNIKTLAVKELLLFGSAFWRNPQKRVSALNVSLGRRLLLWEYKHLGRQCPGSVCCCAGKQMMVCLM